MTELISLLHNEVYMLDSGAYVSVVCRVFHLAVIIEA